jgi:hypothetical protein
MGFLQVKTLSNESNANSLFSLFPHQPLARLLPGNPHALPTFLLLLHLRPSPFFQSMNMITRYQSRDGKGDRQNNIFFGKAIVLGKGFWRDHYNIRVFKTGMGAKTGNGNGKERDFFFSHGNGSGSGKWEWEREWEMGRGKRERDLLIILQATPGNPTSSLVCSRRVYF